MTYCFWTLVSSILVYLIIKQFKPYNSYFLLKGTMHWGQSLSPVCVNIAGNWAHQKWMDYVMDNSVVFKDDPKPTDKNVSNRVWYTVEKCNDSKPCKNEEQRLSFHLDDKYFIKTKPCECERDQPCAIHQGDHKKKEKRKRKHAQMEQSDDE